MEEYECKCPSCTLVRNGINSFYCVRNTGMCEDCLERRGGRPRGARPGRKQRGSEMPDPFETARRSLRPDEVSITRITD